MIIQGLFLLAIFALNLLFFIRIDWVYRKRQYISDTFGPLMFARLPSLHSMLWRFWVWDIRRFIGKGEKL